MDPPLPFSKKLTLGDFPGFQKFWHLSMGPETVVVNSFRFSNVQRMQYDLFHDHTTSTFEYMQGNDKK